MDFAALQHSVFLQALGSAILNSLWQCFILWFLYETVLVSYKSASARFKNNLSTLTLFLCFAWFLTSLTTNILNHQNETLTAITTASGLQQSIEYKVSDLRMFLTYASSSLPYLSVAYIFLLFFLVFRLFAAYRYVYYISKKRLLNSTGELRAFASKVARQIGITKKVSVWISNHIDVPATIGFFKPVILIPLASINNLSGQQLEAIILHELAHIKRNDYVINLLISVIETILFFNPFVVLLSNVIKRERENCCDDFVLQYRYDPHSYASALLRLEQSRTGKLKLAIGAVSGKKQLLSRIKRITNNQAISRQLNYGQKLLALLLVTLCICSVAWLSPGGKKPEQLKAEVKKIEASPISKIKIPDEVKLSEEVIGDSHDKNLSPAKLSHASTKNNVAALAENNFQNLPSDNFYVENNKKNDGTDFMTSANIANKSGGYNLKQPAFFFDENNLKLPKVINIQDFPFQSMGLTIDLSSVDVEKLNESLKQAYKEINKVDWKKIENAIHKSLPKMMSKNFPKAPQAAFDNVKAISEMGNFIEKKPLKSYLAQLNKEIWTLDSLREISASKTSFVDESNARLQREYQKLQKLYKSNTTDNYYYYSRNVSNTDQEAKEECPSSEISSPPNAKKRNIRISVRSNNDHTGVLNEKKHFTFTFEPDETEKSNNQGLISVESDILN